MNMTVLPVLKNVQEKMESYLIIINHINYHSTSLVLIIALMGKLNSSECICSVTGNDNEFHFL